MIYSRDEWSPLRHIIVGSATHANWPTNDPVFAREGEKTTWHETPVPSGPVEDHIVAEANEDLATLSQTLEDLGVRVSRPADMDFCQRGGMYNYCPRDRLLVWGDTVIDPAMMYPCRDQEIECYQDLLASDTRVISMPRDRGLVLDAANVCRLGDTLLFLESASGNRAAYEWLCEALPDANIELCNFYAGVHIDSTIVPLRQGLVLLNGTRVNRDNLPRVFRDWECIWVQDVVAQSFYQYPYASKWIAMNMLVVDPQTVIMDADQPELIETVVRRGFTVYPRRLRHSRTLGGGFHCVTLDLERGTG